MSSAQYSRHRSQSSTSKHSMIPRHTPPPTTLTPENAESEFEPCSATASFLLYAQRNIVLVLHHDTLAIERRFDLHREDVRWIVADNVSERGAGRVAVSYDAGGTVIVWDIINGSEIARFAAYDVMNIACFMRNGNIAFGNAQGSIILFEPSTSEHISARTIFDPITAIAPSTDCRTFAIGYLNGSILVATLQPAFTILHTLTTSRAPSKITGLAWHGSSAKQKTDMLATQTSDGDLRVWSVPKVQHSEAPAIIRVLGRSESTLPNPCWFAWSKNGRIVQHVEGETRSWDVRTKKVTYEVIPTIDGVVGISIYGPTATLFTLGHGHTVQQYDITPNSLPMQVQSVQHMPSNTPPTPPNNLDEPKNAYGDPMTAVSTEAPLLPIVFTDAESSADEGGAMSPLQKIAHEMDSLDALESELRDKVMPLSPTSSRTSSVSSRSSGGGRRQRKYLYDRPSSSRASTNSGYEGTEFSFGGPSVRQGHESSMSIRSASTRASHARFQSTQSSTLRKEVLRSPQESNETASMDLFPCVKARLREVAFRTPHYGQKARTPEVLQREMLSVVFGWNDDIESLVRDELARHRPGSASGVLLAKWMGDMGADAMASMVGSESMTSSDWMLLALSSIGQDSQKKVGEAFVQRLLEKGDIHPAVAILLGLREYNDAVEVYVSQSYYMEAVILTCLSFPSEWNRQSFLLRKWGEVAVKSGEPELAVRIFSCTSVETSEPWFSPRAQDEVYAAQQQRLMSPTSPPLSPPSRSGSGRLTQKNASLKLITSFGARGVPMDLKADDPTPLAAARTPMLDTALSPRGTASGLLKASGQTTREPSTARTATPGGYGRRKRFPSKGDTRRGKQDRENQSEHDSRAPSIASTRSRTTSTTSDIPEPKTALKPTVFDAGRLAPGLRDDDHLPSPAQGVFARLKQEGHRRQPSRDRKPEGLALNLIETRYSGDPISPGPTTRDTATTGYSEVTENTRAGALSPPLTGVSMKSAKTKAIDAYISSVEEARSVKRAERAGSRARAESRRRGESQSRAQSRTRTASRAGRGSSRARDRSEVRGEDGVKYIKPAKRSPSSPVPMSPEEIAQATFQEFATADDEDFYKMTSPVVSQDNAKSGLLGALEERRASGDMVGHRRSASYKEPRHASPDRDMLHADDERGRDDSRGPGSLSRSPSSPQPLLPSTSYRSIPDDTQSDGRRIFLRKGAANRQGDDLQSRRIANRGNARERSVSRRPKPRTMSMRDTSRGSESDELADLPMALDSRPASRTARALTRKEIAAKELEQRRLSLARRPSAPSIPLPGEITPGRPGMSYRSHTDLSNSPQSFMPPLSRSQTVDPEAMMRHGKTTGTSTTSAPIGLPATPRAMRHPRYMSSDPNERDAPPVPEIPDNASALSGLSGSSLSQLTTSNLSQHMASNSSQVSSSVVSDQLRDAEPDGFGALLPSTVFGMKGPQAPARSASAPPEKFMGNDKSSFKPGLPASVRRLSGGRGHFRKISPPEHQMPNNAQEEMTSIDQALHNDYGNDQQVVIIPEEPESPRAMLPELQHLAGPPPPPPPPAMYQQHQHNNSGTIEIAIDGPESAADNNYDFPQGPTSFPQPMDRAATTSPSMTRSLRNRGSVSESLGSRMRGVADRMRSNSRSRGKHPPTLESYAFKSPYETVLPPIPGQHQQHHQRRESISRAKSPYEQAMAEQQMSMPPPPPPPPAPPAPGTDFKFTETVVPPRSQSAMGGYRHPKELRANMPPSYLQAGAEEPSHGGFL